MPKSRQDLANPMRLVAVTQSPIYTERCEDIECRHQQYLHIELSDRSGHELNGRMRSCRGDDCLCQRYRSAWWDQALMKKES